MRSLLVPRMKPMPPRICTAWSAQNCMVCVAWFFSMQTSATQRAASSPPACSSPASARLVSACAQAWVLEMRICISTNLWRITWRSIMAWPKVLRCRAQSSASSKQAWAKPSASTDMPRRSPLKLPMIILKPVPSAPTRYFAGTRTLSKRMCAVSEQSQPILSSRERETPGKCMGMTMMEMPAAPLLPASPVRTAVVTKSARMPDVMKIFSPLMR